MTKRGTVLGGGLTAMAALALGGCIPRDTSEAGRLEAQFRLIEVATGGTRLRSVSQRSSRDTGSSRLRQNAVRASGPPSRFSSRFAATLSDWVWAA